VYAKNNNRVTYFCDTNAKHTEKVFYGRVSESIKTTKTDADGKAIYEYESWNARFVGNALEKAKGLQDGQRITLNEWAAHCPYDKTAKRPFPYLMVMDFSIPEDTK